MVETSKRIRNWTRDELEDSYLRIYDDNVKLKKFVVEQDTKIKQMATKILRMANDKTSLSDTGPNKMSSDEYEQQIYSQQKKITELTNKLYLLQSQKNLSNPKTINNSSTRIAAKTAHSTYAAPSCSASKADDNLQELRNQKAALEMGIRQLSEQKLMADKRISELQDQLNSHDHTWQEQLRQTQLDAATKQRMALQENMQLIRVQRELQEKKNNITMTEAQLNQISTSLQATEAANRELITTLERAQREVQAAESKIGLLQTELAATAGYKLKVAALENLVSDYQRENRLLKETNEKLTAGSINQITSISASTVNTAPVQDPSSSYSKELQEKLCHLESTIDSVQRQRRESYADVSAVQTALQMRADKVDTENMQLKRQLEEAKQRPVGQASSMQALCQAVGVDVVDLETALMILREKKMQKKGNIERSSNLAFFQQNNSSNENSCEWP